MTSPQVVQTTANERTVRDFLVALDRKQGIPTEFLAPGFTFVFNSDKPTDLAGWQGLAKFWFTAFPDSKHAVESTFASADQVFARVRATGVHKGPLGDVPASGKPVNIIGHVHFTFNNGKIARVEPVWDMLTLMQQVGAIPTPGQG